MSFPTFDLAVLRSFLSGVEAGSFAKAADRLGRSTSAISAQLKKLEEQIGTPILRKAGRGLEPTPAGEMLLAYARRLLALNDEAVEALRGTELSGSIRLGLQEDFSERLLTTVLGRFARAHPRVHIDLTVGRNSQLLDMVSADRLDLALAWDGTASWPHGTPVSRMPMQWIAAADMEIPPPGSPIPLVLIETPCLMRQAATSALDHAGLPWRIAVTSHSLSGSWAAVSAGLGVTVRTSAGVPAHLRILEALPPLPSVGLTLYRSRPQADPLTGYLEATLLSALKGDHLTEK